MKVPPIEDMCGFLLGDFQQGVVQHMKAVFQIDRLLMSAISGHFPSRNGHKLLNGGSIGRITKQ